MMGSLLMGFFPAIKTSSMVIPQKKGSYAMANVYTPENYHDNGKPTINEDVCPITELGYFPASHVSFQGGAYWKFSISGI